MQKMIIKAYMLDENKCGELQKRRDTEYRENTAIM